MQQRMHAHAYTIYLHISDSAVFGSEGSTEGTVGPWGKTGRLKRQTLASSVPTLQKPPHYPFSGEGRKHT